MRLLPILRPIAVSVALSAFAWPASSYADDAAAAPHPSAPAAPDIVLLKNGGMLRGTISEMIPSDSVSIVTAGGETRKIAMSEVTYAGPADKAPSSKPAEEKTESAPPAKQDERARPFITVHAKEARLAIQGAAPGLTLHVRTGGAVVEHGPAVDATAYDTVCTAPCDASLPAGTYQFGISSASGAPVPVDEPVKITGSGTLKADYRSNAGKRVVGWVAVLGGAIGGGLLAGSGLCTGDDCSMDSTRVFGGFALLGGGLVLGALLIRKDDASVRFIPAVDTALGHLPTSTGADALTVARPYGAPGLSVQATF